MCVVSNVGDAWSRTFPERYPNVYPYTQFTSPIIDPNLAEEVAKLQEEVKELRELLQAAKHFDEVTGQPDCEVDEKVELIKRVAELVGVDLGDLFQKGLDRQV